MSLFIYLLVFSVLSFTGGIKINVVPAESKTKHRNVTNDRGTLLEDCSICPESRFLIHYTALGCTPRDKYNCKNCPMYFECLELDNNSKGCNYLGKNYEVGDEIFTGNECQSCICTGGTENKDGKGMIDCALVECPEDVLRHKFKSQYSSTTNTSLNCYFTYTKDKCCGRQVCPSIASLKGQPTCRYDGKEYRSGERIYPTEDPCKVCICSEKWNPMDFENNPDCKNIKCYYEQKDLKMIENGCTPVFEDESCCPTDYICPSRKESEQIDLRVKLQAESMSTCVFNNTEYPIGFVKTMEDPCLTCTCEIPPYLSCRKQTCPQVNPKCKPIYDPNVCCPINCVYSQGATALDRKIQEKRCPEPYYHQYYTERGCTPVRNATDCVVEYKCPQNNYTNTELSSGCLVRNKLYFAGQLIPSLNPCQICRCTTTDNEPPSVNCLYIECPWEAFRIPPGLPPSKGVYKANGCYYQYQQQKCCGTPICPSGDKLTSNFTCQFKGETYRAGQKMYPNSSCTVCICTQEWKEELGEKSPGCEEIRCPIIPSSLPKERAGCVPIYEDGACCPTDYYCATERKPHSPFDCQFNGVGYPIGSRLQTNLSRTECVCITPPLFSCKRNTEAQNALPGRSLDVPMSSTVAPGCWYLGHLYAFGQRVPTEPCRVCTCKQSTDVHSVAGVIDCYQADCVEDVGQLMTEEEKLNKTCYLAYKHDECCGFKKCFDKKEVETVKKCKRFGTSYMIGEKYHVEEECRSCICSEDFDSKQPGRSVGCREHECLRSSTHLENIASGCIPVFLPKRCCPEGYYCGTKGPELVVSPLQKLPNIDYKDERMQCIFNGTSYGVGEAVLSPDPCVTCRCEIPPMITCERQACPPAPTDSNCKPIYDMHYCCPKYSCQNEMENRLSKKSKEEACHISKIVELYESMSCIPHFVEKHPVCPYRYDCHNLPSQTSTKDGCSYLGKKYRLGKEIPTSDKCKICQCAYKQEKNAPGITCSLLFCPFMKSDVNSSDCYDYHDRGRCCSQKMCLTPEEQKVEPTCEYKGIRYRIGQKFNLEEDKCVECICTEDFNATLPLLSSGCRRKKCFVKDEDSEKLNQGCVPVYEQNDCCPTSYFCPNVTSMIQEKACVFKHRSYPIGSKLETDMACWNCECQTPPNFTCERRICPPPSTPDCPFFYSAEDDCCPVFRSCSMLRL